MSNLTYSENFKFPYEPYDIQAQFMKELFYALEEKKLGIFESPTGTGKSLSLICGALSWFCEHTKHEQEELKNIIGVACEAEDNTDDWFESATKRIEKETSRKTAQKRLEKIEKHEKKMQNLRLRKQNLKFSGLSDNRDKPGSPKNLDQIRNVTNQEVNCFEGDEDISLVESEFLLDYDISDGEESSDENQAENEEDDFLKIYYCSRTHSQLSQFIREIQKTKYKDDVRVVSLASRQNLCINDNVLKLSNLSLINERCLDMQKGSRTVTDKSSECRAPKKKKVSSSCPFNKQTNIQNVSHKVLTEVLDLEQLTTAGKRSNGCPYYASRNSIKDGQLIVLPYQCLLHKGTREACNIKLKDNVVIVDEAHNLLETISNIHSVTLFYNQICGALSQVSQYLNRYEKLLSVKNLLFLRQIIFFLKSFLKLLSKESSGGISCSSASSNASQMMMVQQLLSDTFTDNLNIFQLVQYIEKSRLAHKLHGFSKMFEGQLRTKQSEQQRPSGMSTSDFLSRMTGTKSKQSPEPNENSAVDRSVKESDAHCDESFCGSPLLSVVEFMKAITCSSSDGRVIVTTDKLMKKSFVKFLLLNPASQFYDIVQQCRSVIVAGGTMSPVEEFRDQLFLSAGVSPERLVYFSCGHVIPKENILPIVLKEGPGGLKLDFTFKNRNDKKLLDDLGRILVNICNVISGGIVVFFPSYDYEEQVNSYFMQTGVYKKLGQKKQVFREPRKAGQMDKVLSEYARAVRENVKGTELNKPSALSGALVFSVVGGKMSEGINFSDDLGRCVVMVGLPYPNATSPELKEKMTYLNTHYPTMQNGKTAGATFYENLCFKAVNQCIGRSIRHKNDYSSILLLDYRYASDNAMATLPKWISSHVKVCDKFGSAFGLLRKFFADKKDHLTR